MRGSPERDPSRRDEVPQRAVKRKKLPERDPWRSGASRAAGGLIKRLIRPAKRDPILAACVLSPHLAFPMPQIASAI